jgi:uncharacterized protein
MKEIVGFDWDEGNLDKNWIKHQVSHTECEEVFFNLPLMIEKDIKHSRTENRYYVLGRTLQNRLLFIVFTKRENKIRVISARDANRKERKIYEKANTTI